MDRLKTLIPGLDGLIQGGIPEGSAVLISGGAGTCKTIFTLQYLYEGAVQEKDPGLFVTLESNVKNITWNMQNFNWDFKKLQDDKLLSIYRLKLDANADIDEQIESELEIVASIVKEMGAKRLVIDSTTAFGVWIPDPGQMRSLLYKFTDGLKNIGCTTLMTAETKGGRKDFSAFGVEEFVVDGVIALYFTPPHRSIFIRKMRGTDHSKSIHPFEITSKGIKIRGKEQIMWESIQ